jgi:hypothetical protein
MLNGPRKTAANAPQPPQGPPMGKARRIPARGAAKKPKVTAAGPHQKKTKRRSGRDNEATNFGGTGRDTPPSSRAERSEAAGSGTRLNGTVSSGVERGVSPSSNAKQGGGSSPPSSAKRDSSPSPSTRRKDPPPSCAGRRVEPSKPTKPTKNKAPSPRRAATQKTQAIASSNQEGP